jgi:hypothetical protein
VYVLFAVEMVVEIEKATQQGKKKNNPIPFLIRVVFVGVVQTKSFKK